MSSGGRVSIPSSVRKTIQNIKEITGKHSEEEIYAVLKECGMDPNETAQKLLLQDTFHEVRRKRDKKKENLSNESAESRWKPGMQGRPSRGPRGNYSSRFISHDSGPGNNTLSGKENGINQVSEGIGITTMPPPAEKKNKEPSLIASSSTVIADGPIDTAPKVLETTAVVESSKLDSPPLLAPPIDANKNLSISLSSGGPHGQLNSNPGNVPISKTSGAVSGVYLSTSDPVLMPSQDSRLSSAFGTIKREFGSQRTPVGQFPETPAGSESVAPVSEVGSSFLQGKGPSEFQEAGKNHVAESSRPAPSTHSGSSVSRPSSNYSSRSQQVIGPQKGGPSREWKPKTANPIVAQGSGTVAAESPSILIDTQLLPTSSVIDLKEANSELEKKLERSHITDHQHVIIPNHLHVPEAEKLGFCFGSFDATFDFNTSQLNDPVGEKSVSPSETSEGIEEGVGELSSRDQIASINADEGEYADRSPSASNMPENLLTEGEVSSYAVPEYGESKQETVLPVTGHQYQVVQTSPNIGVGFVPPMLGSQLTFENVESQTRDGSRLPNFVIQQHFDPASYYAHFYRAGSDNDGRISPFHAPGVATANKYTGNVAVLSPQATQSTPEVGNSLIMSAAGPTSLAPQASGVLQSSIAVTQQPLPVFRQPSGLHLPHYPPNYFPYGPYFSPFYLPPPAIHQFLSNGSFPQQPQVGGVYSAAQPVPSAKFPLPQYKPGSNPGNSTNVAIPGSYGPYSSSPAGYNPSSAANTGNLGSDEDLAGSQFKESNGYITGQQTEGTGVWLAAPGRDISALQASSFYNVPQGQVAFAPTQAGPASFAGIYHHHPPQPVTTGTIHPLLQQPQSMAGGVDMVGPASSVFQQPQSNQINWPNNY